LKNQTQSVYVSLTTEFDWVVHTAYWLIGGTMMNLIRTRFIQSLRNLLILFTCAVFLLANTASVLALGQTAPTKLTKGEVQLNKILDKSEKTLQNGLPSLSGEETRANQGINGVQGKADMNKMNRPDNSRQAVSIEDQIETGLKKAERKG
jgi:hypothetical protein